MVGVRVHVVAGPRLARSTVPPAIVSDAAVTAGGQKRHLIFERVSAQRPPVAEHHRLAGAPVLVIDLSPVLCRDRRHNNLPFTNAMRGSNGREQPSLRPERVCGGMKNASRILDL